MLIFKTNHALFLGGVSVISVFTLCGHVHVGADVAMCVIKGVCVCVCVCA